MRLGAKEARKLRGLMQNTLTLANDWDYRLCDPDAYAFRTYPRQPEDPPGLICHYVAECQIPGYEYWTIPYKIDYADLKLFRCDLEGRKQMIRMFLMEALVAKAQQIHNSQVIGDNQARILAAGAMAAAGKEFKTD